MRYRLSPAIVLGNVPLTSCPAGHGVGDRAGGTVAVGYGVVVAGMARVGVEGKTAVFIRVGKTSEAVGVQDARKIMNNELRIMNNERRDAVLGTGRIISGYLSLFAPCLTLLITRPFILH